MNLNSVNSIKFAGAQTEQQRPKKSYIGRVVGTTCGLAAGGAVIYFGVPKANGKNWPGIIGGMILGTAYAIGAFMDSKKAEQ